MRILLIEPPFERLMGFYRDYYPIGLAYLAAVLEKAGHSVKVYDAEHSPKAVYLSYRTRASRYDSFLQAIKTPAHPIWQEAREVIREFQPELVGISMMTPKYSPALKMAEFAKEWQRSLPVVMGGPHPTIRPDEVLENPNVDFVIRGEGEEALRDLACAIERAEDNYAQIDNLSFKRRETIIHNPLRPLIDCLDDIPSPARHLLHNAHTYTSEDMGLMMTSRGCPFKCTYCSTRSTWGRKVRFRTVENVIKEMKKVIDLYKTRQITFEDDSFTLDRKRVLELSDRLIEERLNANWSAITRIDLLDEELLLRMKKAGCNYIRVGVESGSDKVLKAIKKGITSEQIRTGARLLNRHRVYWSAYFMIGLPMEDEEDIMASLRLMKEINPSYCTLSIYTPYPGTELFEDLVKDGLATYALDWSKLSHHSPYNYFTKNIPKQRFEQILERVSREFDKHNGRFSALLARALAKSRIYLNEPGRFLQDFKRFLYWSGIFKNTDYAD